MGPASPGITVASNFAGRRSACPAPRAGPSRLAPAVPPGPPGATAFGRAPGPGPNCACQVPRPAAKIRSPLNDDRRQEAPDGSGPGPAGGTEAGRPVIGSGGSVSADHLSPGAGGPEGRAGPDAAPAPSDGRPGPDAGGAPRAEDVPT